MTPAHDAVLCCPHCGGVLLVRPAALQLADTADDRERGAAVQSCTSTSTSTKNNTYRTSTPAPLEQGALPLPPALARPTTTAWKRALAIAHKAIDDYPDSGASQTDRFKELCAHQGIDYGELGPDGRPLYARALDYALTTRRRRAAGR